MESRPHLCGDAGGVTAKGAPCKRPSKDGALCAIHDGTAPVGRPPIEITDEQVEHIEKLAAVLTQNQIADFLGITDRTFREKLTTDARITSAYARGRAKAIAAMGRSVFRDGLAGDSQAARFYLSTQGGWRETQKHEHSGEGGGPIEWVVTHARRDDGDD